MPSRLPKDALIKCTIEGLEVDSDWPELKAYLKSQARFNQLGTGLVTPKGGGIAVVLQVSRPKIVSFRWRDYEVKAAGFMGEIHIVCRKNA